jgi:amino acid adenylation domain-containing protein
MSHDTASPSSPEASAFRLSPQQSFLLGSGRVPLVSQCLLRLEPGRSEDAVRAALESVVDRNESLRTTFPTPVGAKAPVAQTIHERLAPGWETAASREDRLSDLPAALAREAELIDVEQGPSLRALAVIGSGGVDSIVLTALSACADPHSLRLIAAELYSDGAGQNGAGPTDPIQYADYAEWRHELAGGDDPEAVRGRGFWSQVVEGYDAPRPPFAAAESSQDTEAGDRHVLIELTAREQDALAAVAGELGATPTDVVQAAWLALLARITGEGELLVAAIEAGRALADLADAIGPYAQIVPIRVIASADMRFAELLDRVGRARREAASRQDYGLDADLAETADRALAGFTDSAVSSEGIEFSSLPRTGCAVELAYRPAGILELNLDGRVYGAQEAEDLASTLRALLGSVLADHSQALAEFDLVDAGQRAELLALATAPGVAADLRPVHIDIERRAAEAPDRPAVVGAGQELTFGALNEAADQLATYLTGLGVVPGQPVGLCLRRSPAMLTALLGILKAGAAYLPVNFAHPAARIAHQLSESGATVVVTEDDLLERVSGLEGVIPVCVDRDREQISAAAGPPGAPRVDVGSDDLAYVMYTSGSTGMPKGVAVTHGNLASYTAAITDRLGTQAPLSSAVVSEISTDLGNTAIFPILAGGGCVHLIDPELSMDGAALAEYIAEHEIDLIKITPTHLRALLAADERCLPGRWLVLGGEALSWELADRIIATGMGCRVLNHYGPTEATIGCSTFEVVPAADRPPSATVPIGRPLAGARTYILDERLEPVPVGVIGELCVGGAGVARGYVNRLDETAARFVADPQGGRMYRTGDRARRDRDGSIEFLGRSDHQLKIRGYRVEPGEIETGLLRHPGVREAAVLAREDGEGDPRLVAYYTASGVEVGELQAFLAQSLPEYMLPSRWVPVTAFPLTASGKIDRQALPDPETVQAGRDENFVAPRDEVEQEIAAIWASLLGIERVGAFDDFFALGGHSLLATQAIMRIRRRYGSVALGAIFNSPTVAALADVIRARDTPE